jgi:hypothetical protein
VWVGEEQRGVAQGNGPVGVVDGNLAGKQADFVKSRQLYDGTGLTAVPTSYTLKPFSRSS